MTSTKKKIEECISWQNMYSVTILKNIVMLILGICMDTTREYKYDH